MFSIILKEVTGMFDRRFLMNLFFPSLVFWGLLIVVWFLGRGNLAEAAKAWSNQETTLLAIEIVGFLALVTLLSYVLGIQLTRILRLYKGYWNFAGGRFLKALAERRHRRKLTALTRDWETNLRSYEEIYFFYPPPSLRPEIMPTLLGNILKNSELYAKERYSIDSVLIWTHLNSLLPERLAVLIAEAGSALDFMLVASSMGATFAIVSGTYLLIVRAEWWLFLICFWGGMLVARTFYHGAIESALRFSEYIRAAFDLYRNELLKQMRVPLPPTLTAEDVLWKDVCLFLYRNAPPPYPYSGPNEVKPNTLEQP